MRAEYVENGALVTVELSVTEEAAETLIKRFQETPLGFGQQPLGTSPFGTST